MARTHVGPDAITFEDVEGKRTQVKLTDFLGKKASDLHGLLLWGIFYQLVEINQRLGSYDHETKHGKGVQGLLAQMTISGVQSAAKLDELLTTMTAIKTQTDSQIANAPTPENAMDQALKLMRAMGMDPTAVTSPAGGNGAGD